MTRKQIDLARELKPLVESVRRVAIAHGITIDALLHDVETALVEDDNFTCEQYLGIYKTIDHGAQARLTIPKKAVVHSEYYAYLTSWGDLVYRPVPQQGRCTPVMVAS